MESRNSCRVDRFVPSVSESRLSELDRRRSVWRVVDQDCGAVLVQQLTVGQSDHVVLKLFSVSVRLERFCTMKVCSVNSVFDGDFSLNRSVKD